MHEQDGQNIENSMYDVIGGSKDNDAEYWYLNLFSCNNKPALIFVIVNG